MIKITAVVPYKELADLFLDVFKKHTEYLGEDIKLYDLDVEIAFKNLDNSGLDADVIVSRGLASITLKRRQHYIPVVEIPVSGNDIVRNIWECKNKFNPKNIAVVGAANMAIGAESLSDIVGVKIGSFIYNTPENINKTVERAVNEGYTTIIGGTQSSAHARSLGCRALIIKTGSEAVWHSISEAKSIAHVSKKENAKVQRYKAILDYAYEGIISVNNEDRITALNLMAAKTLGIYSNDYIGKKIYDVLPKSKLTELLNLEGKKLDEIIKYKGIQLTVNKVPITLRNENIGKVITFQDITKIQEVEGKIRKKIHARGHIAKHHFKDIIGKSEGIQETIRNAKMFSKVDSTILIYGNSGTGKELFAQSIHNYSPRKNGPFVAVNCAALPESILESELFGYVEGAFTGASKGGKAGLFELAHKGTIFLDEISELPFKLQGRLLRVIQEKEIMRLGDNKVTPIDVRIISATNKDLYLMSQEGKFREDLYYRLEILKLCLPTLNERKEDIPLIIDFLLSKLRSKFSSENIDITDKAKNKLQEYNWPGNIRELMNICERLVVLSRNNIINEKEVEKVLSQKIYDKNIDYKKNDNVDINSEFSISKELENVEKERIIEVLKQTKGNKIKAAEILGISRITLWRRIKKFDIE